MRATGRKCVYEGLMMFTMCYTSPDGVYSHCGEVPFEAEAVLEGISPGDEIEVNADVESAICEQGPATSASSSCWTWR